VPKTASISSDLPLPGDALPLGATPSEGGTNFAVASSVADAVTLCLFDSSGAETQFPLPEYDAGVWHGFLPGVKAGQTYGYRASGPYNPAAGLRCNPAKLLLDPYARATCGEVVYGPELLGHSVASPDQASELDSAGHVPLSLVLSSDFPSADHPRPKYSYADTVIYEVHVKGMTMTHAGVPAELRGTYAGLGHEAAIAHLVDLGVTTVELLPVHQNVTDQFLVERGLSNYWGYNTIGFFAPHDGYSARARAGERGGQVYEFKEMVNALHSAGLEVLLDVVFNHTAEGGELGPTFCFRGLDNPSYYRLEPDDPRHYVDTTGCGNSLNAANPLALRLIMDSLRYWASEMHIDGFRFDLAATLGRQEGSFDRVSAFFDLVAQDPVVSGLKLIAEPWDVGQSDSYDLGDFPPMWREWNGRYRDSVRDFWRSQPGLLGEFADRLTGSADLYRRGKRRPTASVNLITVHDGFTLTDLVSYNNKHNEANGEQDRDGTGDNRSWNCGTEGPSDDPAVVVLRERQRRALLATLVLSFGVPMLLGGDEVGRTQQGNNNAYCQDNSISWYDWRQADQAMTSFVKQLLTFRREHPVFRRKRFLAGVESSEIEWFTPAGAPMTVANWTDPNARCVAVFLDGSDDPDRGEDGAYLIDDDFLVLVNSWWEPITFAVPQVRPDQLWTVEIDTSDPGRPTTAGPLNAGAEVTVDHRSLVVCKAKRK
jgi:isoamylase